MNPATRANRIRRELIQLSEHPPPRISCWSVQDNLNHLAALIVADDSTPYAGGVFRLDIRIPDRYPFEPPNISFATPIYHPNIDSEGRICLESLKMPPQGGWSPALNIGSVLQTIMVLMAEPNPSDPLMVDIAKEFQFDKSRYEQTAREWTKKYALYDSGGVGEGNKKSQYDDPAIFQPSVSLNAEYEPKCSTDTLNESSGMSEQIHCVTNTFKHNTELNTETGSRTIIINEVINKEVKQELIDFSAPENKDIMPLKNCLSFKDEVKIKQELLDMTHDECDECDIQSSKNLLCIKNEDAESKRNLIAMKEVKVKQAQIDFSIVKREYSDCSGMVEHKSDSDTSYQFISNSFSSSSSSVSNSSSCLATVKLENSEDATVKLEPNANMCVRDKNIKENNFRNKLKINKKPNAPEKVDNGQTYSSSTPVEDMMRVDIREAERNIRSIENYIANGAISNLTSSLNTISTNKSGERKRLADTKEEVQVMTKLPRY